MMFSAQIQFKDSAKNAYALRVFVEDRGRRGIMDAAIWCDATWEQVCEMLMDIEKKARVRNRIRKPLNRHLHLVRS